MTDTPTPPSATRRFDSLHVTLLVLLAIVLTALLSYVVLSHYLFPDEFRPVRLKPAEQQRLQAKLEYLESGRRTRRGTRRHAAPSAGRLQAEPYSESAAAREVVFSERELNALLGRDPELARRLAIDLSDKLLSAKLLVPLDEDFPLLGGRTVKLHAGLTIRMRNGKPVIILQGISVMGVPLPNAWLGGIKHTDLIEEFGQQGGFWQAFAEGIEDIQVKNGQLVVRLRE